jgi:YgiT-type zinc finger domain-containing protein
MMDICPNCHAGALHKRLVTYAAWHTLPSEGGEQFVIAHRVPAWLCDVCGAKLFDAEALAWLAPLLGPNVDMDAVRRLSTLGRGSETLYEARDSDLDQGHAQ